MPTTPPAGPYFYIAFDLFGRTYVIGSRKQYEWDRDHA